MAPIVSLRQHPKNRHTKTSRRQARHQGISELSYKGSSGAAQGIEANAALDEPKKRDSIPVFLLPGACRIGQRVGTGLSPE
ncbi:MAG: hypothetical protein CMF63_04000 [Magnetovibrio sp.]|nr:hypothetical protein [Magnetovibrio sp.]